LQQLAMILRHRTSSDLWRTLSQLDDRLTRWRRTVRSWRATPLALSTRTLLGLAAFQGLARENMTRAQGWRFLEWLSHRARAVCQHVPRRRAAFAGSRQPSVLEAVLEVCDSTITYRSRYNLLPHIVAVYDLVLLDDTNPRSILFQLSNW